MSRGSAPDYRVHVRIDGQSTPLKPFIHDIVGGGILGMLEGLKGAEVMNTVEIRVERRSAPSDPKGPNTPPEDE